MALPLPVGAMPTFIDIDAVPLSSDQTRKTQFTQSRHQDPNSFCVIDEKQSPYVRYVLTAPHPTDLARTWKKMAREICVWSSLKHENVLKLHGMLYRNNNALPSLVADFMEMGTAYQFIKNCPDADLINLVGLDLIDSL